MQIIRRETRKKNVQKSEDPEDLIEAWIEDLKRTKAPDTVLSYSLSVQRPYLRWLDKNRLDLFTVGPMEIEDWLSDMARSVSKATIALRFYSVRNFYKWLYKHREITFDPTYAAELPRSQVKSRAIPRKPLSNEQIRDLIATCDDSYTGIRAKAIISLMAYTAMRGVEVHRANVDDFDKRDGRIILYVWGKGQEQRDAEYVKLRREIEPRIGLWLKVRGQGGKALFTYRGRDKRRLSRDRIYDIVKDKLVEIGINQSPHALRHSAITNALKNGEPIRQVQMMARHRSVDSTNIYAHQVGRFEFASEDAIDYGEWSIEVENEDR